MSDAESEGERSRISELLDTPGGIDRLVEALAEDKLQARDRSLSPEYRERLDHLCASLLDSSSFEVGMLVQWKDGLKNKRRPEYGSPAIVIQLLNEPRYDTSNQAGSQYFWEPLDMIIGILIDDEDDLTVYHVDSRRFEAFKAS